MIEECNRNRVTTLQTITVRLRKGARAQQGFTLIELLVVIIIIAVLASIAIPAFLGQRQKAQDAVAYSLVRNALTAVQGAFVDKSDYTKVTLADLQGIEPGINWIVSNSDLVTVSPVASISGSLTAQATANQVAFFPESATVADLASISESGDLFGIQLNTVNINQTGYVKVKVVDGSAGVGW